MRHFSERGVTIAILCTPRYLNRTESTLKRYARKFSLAFPDYVPMALLPPKVKKT